jgi:hypothetical protein
MQQLAIPLIVSPDEITRQRDFGEAIDLCAKVAGYALDKQLQQRLGVDKAQFSRWHAGTEGVCWPKLCKLMDECGNDAPVLWMLYQRGYDVRSVRRVESAVERENRELREQLQAARRLLIGVAS